MCSHKKVGVFAVAALFGSVLGDTNDWVNPSYVLRSTADAGTASSRDMIIKGAKTTAAQGPWTVSESGSVLAPNNDRRDYLSWAPYHWPDCNWCSAKGTTHLANSNGTGSSGGDSADRGSSEPDDTNESDGENDDDIDGSGTANDEDDGDSESSPIELSPDPSQRRMAKRFRRDLGSPLVSNASPTEVDSVPGNSIPVQTSIPSNSQSTTIALTATSLSITRTQTSQSTERVLSGTPAPVENGAKTQKGGAKSKPSCTPSPTTSMPPSATWTTCPYVTRDGKLNPDVRQLHGVNAINAVTQSVIYNTLAYAFTKTASYSKNAASFIDTFFLDPQVSVHPELNFGQVIRGPGQQQGQYLGILDFRGMVKVVNAIQILKASKSPDWTANRASTMNSWVVQYINWLQSSAQGKKAAAAPNNHGTFYANQLTALQIFNADAKSASAAVTNYFEHQFLDQIAASGEQPFEAVRTRPFHYRCFNLEAMITNAKLGDDLGLNLWAAKSKYGATIQTAVDFVMKQDAGKEDVTEILPHVAAAAAAYGDPDGKYAAFLQKTSSTYKSTPYYFYDQRTALSNSPAAKSKRDTTDTSGDNTAHLDHLRRASNDSDLSDTAPTIPFECPEVFSLSPVAQLDDGVFVTCDQLKPFYGYL